MKEETLEKRSMLTSLLLAGLGGLVVGGSAVLILTKNKEEPVEETTVLVVGDETSEAQQEVIKQVTSPDLVSVSCSKEHIDQHGDLLCREMFCRLQQRGIDAKTSSSECEEISNIANTKIIIESCVKEVEVDGEDRKVSVFNEECTRLFRERK